MVTDREKSNIIHHLFLTGCFEILSDFLIRLVSVFYRIQPLDYQVKKFLQVSFDLIDHCFQPLVGGQTDMSIVSVTHDVARRNSRRCGFFA